MDLRWLPKLGCCFLAVLVSEFSDKLNRFVTPNANDGSGVSGDSLLRSTTNKLSSITAEVESLKAVLEMKSEELRALRADKIRLEEKLVDFDQMKASLQKATALVEDLKAQIEAKNNLER